MKNSYKKILAFLSILLISFSLTISTTNAFNIIIEKERVKLFNLDEFKIFYKIKYLQYIILEKQKSIETNDNSINIKKFNQELYWENLSIITKIKLNKILKNIFLEENKIERTKKLMAIYEKAEEICETTKNQKYKNAMKYLKIRIALNF